MMMMIQKRMMTMTILLLLLMLLSGCNVRILILMLSGYNVTSVRNGGNFHQRTAVSSYMYAVAVVSYCDVDEDAADAQHHEVGVSGWKLRQTHTGKTYWYHQQEEQQLEQQKEEVLPSPNNDNGTSTSNININIIAPKKNGGKQRRR